ncbi:hypothetical protein [Mesorhizobium sp. M0011]|uniref:hypothetical protein n=1 Tax=Mesorhizobium sp. M0011 TaxID=2956839 RepID=UPI00333A64F8
MIADDNSRKAPYAGEIVVYPGAGYGTTNNPAFAGEIERLWRLDQSAFLRRPHRADRNENDGSP